MKRMILAAEQEKVLTREERIRLFGEEPQGKIVIPEGYTSIGDYAFHYRSDITRVIMPNSVTSIGEDAFYCCGRLESVIIGDSVTHIDSHAFSYCHNLTNVIIGNSVESIGYFAFCSCGRLTNITIPNSVTRIDDYAFAGCTSLRTVNFEGNIDSIEFGDDVFTRTALENESSKEEKTSIEPEFSLEDFENDLDSLTESAILSVNDGDIGWEYDTPELFSNAVLNYMYRNIDSYMEMYDGTEEELSAIIEKHEDEIIDQASQGDFDRF